MTRRHPSRSSLASRAPLLLLLLLTTSAACATTGSTLGSGVGDARIEHPPYYAGNRTAPGRVGHLPLVFQRGGIAASAAAGGREHGAAIDALVADMNAYLDSLGVTVKLATPQSPPRGAPDVMFGCAEDASGDCETATGTGGAGLLTMGYGANAMRLAVGRPSADWTAWMADAAQRGGAGSALVLTLEMGQYFPRQRDLKGSKEVELGSGYTMPLPWLTSLDTPVSVLQITGARVGPDGKALRIGAEGVLARRTRLLLSAVGGQELITDEDVASLRSARRTDLPGSPLVWQHALRSLVRELAGA